MDEELYTCEDCNTEHPREHGYMSEAGFECDGCYDKRIDEEYAAMRDFDAIRRNYPDLDRHVAMAEADPAGFYHACKNDPDSLYR